MSGQHPLLRAFTLIELLVVITIIVVLIGLLLPAIAMVKNSVNKGAAEAMIQGLDMAMEVYFQEEPRKRLPPVDSALPSPLASPDHQQLRTNMVVTGPKRALDLLREKGLEWRLDQVDSTSGGLLDPWGRPYQYRPDDNMDGTADRPASRPDWNGKDREPYAYIWSYGKPKDNTDKNPSSAERWIYKKIQP